MEVIENILTILLIVIFVISIHQAIRLTLNKTTSKLLKRVFFVYLIHLIIEINFSPFAAKQGWNFSDSPMYQFSNVMHVLFPFFRGVIYGTIAFFLFKQSYGKFRISIFALLAIEAIVASIRLLIAFNTPSWP